MSRSLRPLLLLCLLALLGGCATGDYVVLLESPDGSTGAVVVEDAKGQTRIDRSHQGMVIGGQGAGSGPFKVSELRISRRRWRPSRRCRSAMSCISRSAAQS